MFTVDVPGSLVGQAAIGINARRIGGGRSEEHEDMKIVIAATALSLVAGAAFAGEGQGNPFPFTANPIVVSTQGYRQAPGVAQNPFPYTTPGIVMNSTPVLPTTGSDGVLQTANSMPPGFENGAGAASSLNRNVPTPTQLAQPVAPASRTHG